MAPDFRLVAMNPDFPAPSITRIVPVEPDAKTNPWIHPPEPRSQAHHCRLKQQVCPSEHNLRPIHLESGTRLVPVDPSSKPADPGPRPACTRTPAVHHHTSYPESQCGLTSEELCLWKPVCKKKEEMSTFPNAQTSM